MSWKHTDLTLDINLNSICIQLYLTKEVNLFSQLLLTLQKCEKIKIYLLFSDSSLHPWHLAVCMLEKVEKNKTRNNLAQFFIAIFH